MIEQRAWHLRLPRLLLRHWVPLVAFAALVFGCFHPIWELMLPEVAPLFGKVLYALYLAASFALLSLTSPRLGVRSSGWWCVEVVLCTYTVVPVLQLLLRLPRPDGSPIDVFYGFPSGHSVAAFALAWMVHEAHPRWALPWFGVAVVIGLSRIESAYHFPYQVLGGAALGLALGWWIGRHPAGLLAPRLSGFLLGLPARLRPARRATRKRDA